MELNKKYSQKLKEGIQLTEEYWVTKDGYGFTLLWEASKETETTFGKETFMRKENAVGYFASLSDAFRGFIADYTGRYPKSTDDVVRRVQEAQKAIEGLKSSVPESWKIVKVVRG